MNAAAIIAIIAIVGLSALGAHFAEEPLDEVFHTNAAINGFALQPLATKKVLRPKGSTSTSKANRLDFGQSRAESAQNSSKHARKHTPADTGNAAAILTNRSRRSTATR